MKIRLGFVSNSSSSSFWIANSNFETTATVARKMLGCLDRPHNHPVFNAMHWLEEHKDWDGPISFPWSCNYETYIRRNDRGDIEVATCNNEPWNSVILMSYVHEDEVERQGFYLDLESMQMVPCNYYRHRWARLR